MQRIIHFGLLCVLAISCRVSADAMVWEVTRGDNTVYLAGTIHMLKASDYPLPAEYQRAFSEAQTVVFETDMAAVQSPEFAMQMTQLMMLPSGSSLQSELSSDVYAELRQFASARSLPLMQLQQFKPAFVALTYSILEMQKLGFTEGVDVRYSRLASEQGKTLAWLETPEEQLQFIVAMTELDANEFMRYSLEDLEQLPLIMDDMVNAFKSGNDKALFELGGAPMQEYSAELYNTIVRDRNRAWTAHIDQYLASPETELVMVGALHLAGPDSVVEMLRADGYKVERFK
ncbi:TraB/GumN family protein [Gilvimarinus sp. DA14]|uniref:TraB/GumN family protein n=1 Tax=Gilvimarinus sp. DA14 TaxID=2956798 RepID=UPI0020B8E170|nr:TraB/GumN family protein [Gilvimarinus sp. DA14]UTF61844.1 TraB/GumN family protein [Gilvimarinus sp. DA14]